VRDQRFIAIGEELLRAGLSPRRVRRILFELESHLDDLVEELEGHGASRAEAEAEASRRLDAEAVVEAARARTELHSTMQRWPAATFTLLPLFVYAALFAGGMALLAIVLSFAKDLGFPVERTFVVQQVATATIQGIVLILPASVGITFCLLASSRRASLAWTLVGVALVSLLGATTNAQLELPPISPRPALGAGLGFSTDAMGMPLLRAASTFLVVTLLYLWHMRMQRRVA
jgi:hypothetical protein